MKTTLFACLLISTVTQSVAQTNEAVQLKTADLTLVGTLTLPAKIKRAVPVALLIAGSGPTDRNGNNPIPAGQPNSVKSNTYQLLADSLAARGIAVLRYDKRAVGGSVKPGMTEQGLTFENYIQDAVGWLNQLRADKRFSTIIVVGHSEGSLIGMVAARQAKADAFISLAGSGDDIGRKLKTQLGPQLGALDKQETFNALDSLQAGYLIRKLPTPYPAVQQLFRPSIQPYMISWMKYDPAAQISLLTIPVLIIQGKNDLQVTLTDAQRLKAGQPTAKLVVFDQMNHLLKNAPADRLANIATYSQADLPLTPGLVTTMANFIKKPR